MAREVAERLPLLLKYEEQPGCLNPQLAADNRTYQPQRLVQPIGVFASGLGHVGPPAALLLNI